MKTNIASAATRKPNLLDPIYRGYCFSPSAAATATGQPTPTYKIKGAKNAKTGVQGAPSLHQADLPTEPPMRRRATPGTHGGDVGN